MGEVFNSIRETLGNFHFLFLYAAAIFLLLLLMKGRRKAFVIPCCLITLVVINPKFFNVWNEINEYAYWRTLWIIPIIAACAAVPAFFVEKGKKNWTKAGIVILFSAIFVFAGSYIYHQSGTTFAKAKNAEKLPGNAVLVADALLELSDTPSVVTDSDICIYLRQYSGKIRMLFARDIYWGTAGELAQNVYAQLQEPDGDLDAVALTMLNYDYQYLVTNNTDEKREAALRDAGFELVKQIDNLGIYRVTGNPTEKRTYDDRHRVTAVTYVDENGDPAKGADGVATVTYEYDQNDRMNRRFQLDENGNAVADADGKAGYEREYNWRWQIVKETWLGKDGGPVEAGGYAMRSCTYNPEQELESECYFDVSGKPMMRTDTLFAKKELAYDDRGNIISERYYDLDDRLTMASYGFAGIDREYDEEDQLIWEMYINTEGKPCSIEAGYSGFKREYDESGNITAEYFLDENGELTIFSKGYAAVRREYDENGNVIHEWYEDQQGNGVILANGCAGFAREYDSRGNVLEERYLDTEGNEAPANQGYSRLRRVYDAYDRIVRESYLNGDIPYTVDNGYAELVRFYNADGQLTEERYFDGEGKPVISAKGYSVIRISYDKQGRKSEESYFDTNENPAAAGIGYSKCRYTYTEDGRVSLIYYYDREDRQVEAGSGYLHEYLQSLLGKNVSVFMAAKDEASSFITPALYEDMKKFGIQSDLRGKTRNSFYAVVTPTGTVDKVSEEQITYEGEIEGIPYSVMSAGWMAGNACSIVIDGVEYARNARGLNIVVFDNEKKTVIESIAFDTCVQEVTVTR